jgi:hypothetical protein
MARKKGTSEEVEKKANKFGKKQILSSKRFEDRRDAVGSILEDDKTYSIDEVEKLYEEFMKGEVK